MENVDDIRLDNVAESGGSDGNENAVADADTEVVPKRRKSERIAKISESARGKGKMSKEEEEEDIEYKSKQAKKKTPKRKKTKVVEYDDDDDDDDDEDEAIDANESVSDVDAIDRVDNGHWELVDGVPNVKKDERSKKEKVEDGARVKKTLRLFNKYYKEAVPVLRMEMGSRGVAGDGNESRR